MNTVTNSELEQPEPQAKASGVRRVALAFAAMHVVLSLRFPWEAEGLFAAILRPNSDLLILLTMAIALRVILRLEKAPILLLTVGALSVFVFRAAFTVMPAFYGKPLVIYNDVLFAPSLIDLLLLHFGLLARIALIIGALLLLAAIFYGTYRTSRVLLSRVAAEGPRRVGLIGLLVFVLACVSLALPSFDFPKALIQEPALKFVPWEIEQTYVEWQAHVEYENSLPDVEQAVAALPTQLDLLQGADVYVLFVESYGRLLFRDPATKAEFEELTNILGDQLQASGFYSCSSYATSAVYGGNSSLAHAQFLSGTGVRSKHLYRSLLASDITAFPHFFNKAGYLTVNAQPSMTIQWPAGKFFGFQKDVFTEDYGYTGHTYHWGFMPDQYSLAYLLKNEIAPAQQPLFLQFVSVTSHAPFTMLPPYFEDWSTVLDEETFNRYPEKTYDIDLFNYAGHPDAEEAYIESIRYSLKTMVGFTVQLERPSIIVMLGDHQPPGIGELSTNDDSFEIPIHIISNRIELLEPFGLRGFQPGFIPTDDYEAFDLSMFMTAFLTAFSQPPAQAETKQ